MHLKISSPEKNVYEGSIAQVTLPTESGEITILPGHVPIVTALKPGVIKIVPHGQHSNSIEYIISKNAINISVGKGMAFIDGKIVRVVTATATTSIKEGEEGLHKRKWELEEQIKQLRKKGSIEEIEKSLIKLEKINADIKLERIKNLA